jgi:hypothetical protein
MRGLDSSEPEVTRVMIAAGISQLPRQDWDLATATGVRSFAPACAKDQRRLAQ